MPEGNAVFRANMDLLLARVVAKQSEVSLDTRGYTPEQVQAIVNYASGKGYNAAYDGSGILIRDLRGMEVA